MIFKELLDELKDDISSAVNELFLAAWKNQTHPQDLLLIDQHGFYSEMLADPTVQKTHNLSPYVIGPDEIGYAESTFYKFIDWYRQSHLFKKSDFEKEIEKNAEAKKQEYLTVQLEQSIYLRFWESDLILKQYNQLSSLAIGDPYDWHLKIPTYAREGSKHELIRKSIRDRIEKICPKFFSLIKNNYLTQLRNAIAHSQFYILGRGFTLLNYSDDPAAHSPLKGLTFDEWYRIFHQTLLLHNETVRAFEEYRKKYKKKTLDNDNRIQIRIIDQDSNESFSDLGIRHDRDEWLWRGNLNDEDLNQE